MDKAIPITQGDVFLSDTEVETDVGNDLGLGGGSSEGICCEWGRIRFILTMTYVQSGLFGRDVVFTVYLNANGIKEKTCSRMPCGAIASDPPNIYGFGHECFRPCSFHHPFEGGLTFSEACPYEFKWGTATGEVESPMVRGKKWWKKKPPPPRAKIIADLEDRHPREMKAFKAAIQDACGRMWDEIVNALDLCKPIDKPTFDDIFEAES